MSKPLVRPLMIAAVAACASPGVHAGPPDIVEDFTSFTGIFGSVLESPTDTGSMWNVIGGGAPSTPSGFRADGNGFHGKCVLWDGAETRAIFQNQSFAAGVPVARQIALTVSFTPAQGGPTQRDFVQVFGDVPLDFSLSNAGITSYAISAGKLNSPQQGIIVHVPLTASGQYQDILIPAAPGQFNKVVIQYTPGSTLLSLDARLKVWVNPGSSTANPDVNIDGGFFASFFGNGGLGRFAIGNATPGAQPPPDPDEPGGARAGSPTVKIDTIGGWYGTSEARAGSLADAIAFFDSFGASAVSQWNLY